MDGVWRFHPPLPPPPDSTAASFIPRTPSWTHPVDDVWRCKRADDAAHGLDELAPDVLRRLDAFHERHKRVDALGVGGGSVVVCLQSVSVLLVAGVTNARTPCGRWLVWVCVSSGVHSSHVSTVNAQNSVCISGSATTWGEFLLSLRLPPPSPP